MEAYFSKYIYHIRLTDSLGLSFFSYLSHMSKPLGFVLLLMSLIFSLTPHFCFTSPILTLFNLINPHKVHRHFFCNFILSLLVNLHIPNFLLHTNFHFTSIFTFLTKQIYFIVTKVLCPSLTAQALHVLLDFLSGTIRSLSLKINIKKSCHIVFSHKKRKNRF